MPWLPCALMLNMVSHGVSSTPPSPSRSFKEKVSWVAEPKSHLFHCGLGNGQGQGMGTANGTPRAKRGNGRSGQGGRAKKPGVEPSWQDFGLRL